MAAGKIAQAHRAIPRAKLTKQKHNLKGFRVYLSQCLVGGDPESSTSCRSPQGVGQADKQGTDLLGLSDHLLRLATSGGAFQNSLCPSAGSVGRMEAAAVGVGVPAEPVTAARGRVVAPWR